ncbi:MAG: RsbT co-antagonist protein rsbRD N-terminal domain [Thermomicrobiales bacterium]|jgi:hypothetical protein|nr:RsbT co-antagonist protein rsbRD N-terminal domain [Thermomicrobiales bacterium]
MTARESHSSMDDLIARSMVAAPTDPTSNQVEFQAAGSGYGEPRPGPATTPGRVAALLRGQASRIVANWVLRAANLPAFRATPNLTLDRLQDAIPSLLDASLTAIASSDPTMDPEPLARALDLAAEHGRSRAGEGFGIGVLLAEYQHLRMEIWNSLWRIVDADPTMASVPRELQSRLTSIFDSLAAAAAEAWVEERLSTGGASQG